MEKLIPMNISKSRVVPPKISQNKMLTVSNIKHISNVIQDSLVNFIFLASYVHFSDQLFCIFPRYPLDYLLDTSIAENHYTFCIVLFLFLFCRVCTSSYFPSRYF